MTAILKLSKLPHYGQEGRRVIGTKGIREVIEHYERCLARFGDDPRGVDWNSSGSQQLRFDILLDAAGVCPDATLLDVGCGIGHLIDHIAQRGLKLHYTGLDASAKMIGAARAKYPNHRFIERDLLSGTGESLPPDSFDCVLSSGMFLVKTETVADDAFEDFIVNMVQRMWELTSGTLVFNLLTPFVDWKQPHLYYANLERLLPAFRRLSRWFILHHDYPLYEFVMCLRREPRLGRAVAGEQR